MSEREFCVWLSGVLEFRKELDLREPHDYAATVGLIEAKLRALLTHDKPDARAAKEPADLFKPRLYHDGAD